jgi:hypothetical protein
MWHGLTAFSQAVRIGPCVAPGDIPIEKRAFLWALYKIAQKGRNRNHGMKEEKNGNKPKFAYGIWVVSARRHETQGSRRIFAVNRTAVHEQMRR